MRNSPTPTPLLRPVPDDTDGLLTRAVQQVLDTLHEPFLVLDGECRVVAASTPFYLEFGLPTDAVLGCSLFGLGDGDWEIPALRLLLETVAPEQELVQDFEVEHTFRELGRRVLSLNVRPLREAGNRIGALVSVRDVTWRRRLSRQVRLILHSAGEGIFGLDLEGSLTFVNPAAARTLGCTEAELVGRPHHEVLRPHREDGSPLPGHESAIDATLRDGTPRRVSEELFRRSDGASFPADYTVTPAEEGGRIVGAVVTFRDVTARREADATLRRAEWLAGIGQTTLAIRHEINNPLTSMLADAALLEMEGNSPEEEREMIASIVRQARRIRDVVHRLAERKDSPSLRQVGSSRMLDLSGPMDEGQ
ncbi:MAG TPA: PAS domain S-box protein [Longimicrobiaceae bacterium]|nr:PAS domain S-box protein [Longimicrobiaceae bacterium]